MEDKTPERQPYSFSIVFRQLGRKARELLFGEERLDLKVPVTCHHCLSLPDVKASKEVYADLVYIDTSDETAYYVCQNKAHKQDLVEDGYLGRPIAAMQIPSGRSIDYLASGAHQLPTIPPDMVEEDDIYKEILRQRRTRDNIYLIMDIIEEARGY